MKKYNMEILDNYIAKENEVLLLIEDLMEYNYRTFAVFINGIYDRRINIKK